MNTFRLSAKLFVKDKILSLSFIAFFIFINFHEVKSSLFHYDHMGSGLLPFLKSCLSLSLLCMVYFLFVSYEYFYKLRWAGLRECVDATGRGVGMLYRNQFLVMLGLNLIVSLAFLCHNVFNYFYLQMNRPEYLVHILLNILLNIFLVCLAATLIGMCVALVCRRLSGYLLLTLFALLTSPVFESVAFTMYNAAEIDIYPAFEFFNLYPPALNWDANSHFGFSLLPYRFGLILFYIFLFAALVLFKLWKHNRLAVRIGAGACALLCLVNLGLYFRPASRLNMSNNPSEALNCDLDYYSKTAQKEEPAGFDITGYDLDLEITHLLSARAVLSLSRSDLPSYKFTLYHGYKVSSAADAKGQALPFRQEGDYIEVEPGPGADLRQIALTYKGWNPKYYSNGQGVCLPGFLAYYPRGGYIKTYDVDKQGFVTKPLSQPAEMRVSVRSAGKVYASLDETGEGRFEGVTDGLTLMSGFVESRTVQGLEVVYPYLNTGEYTPEMVDQGVRDFLEVKRDSHKVRRIFIMPNLNYGLSDKVSIFSDYLCLPQFLGLERTYVPAAVPEEKRELYDLVKSYRMSGKDGLFGAMLRKEAEAPGIATALSGKMEQLGADAALEKADAYLADDGDTRSVMEFLNELQ